MFRILFRKQMQEYFRTFFYDSRKQKKRSVSGIIGYSLLYLFVEFSFILIFTSLSYSLCSLLVPMNMTWLYFAMMAVITVFFSLFINMFTANSLLYNTKDNDLLLSLPIPAGTIVMVRMASLLLSILLLSATILLPAIIVYFVLYGFSFSILIGTLFMFLTVLLLSLSLSTIVGYLVARISTHVRHKNLVTTVLQLVLLCAYMYFYSNLEGNLNALTLQVLTLGNSIHSTMNPLYLLGNVATGNILSILLFSFVTILLAFLSYRLVSHTFLSDVSATGKEKKRTSDRLNTHKNSVFVSLLKKEFSRFFSCPPYILNCSLSTLMLLAGTVYLVIRKDMILTLIAELSLGASGLEAGLTVFAICILACMNDAAAPSVSLEGKNIWILKSLPVKGRDILLSKAGLQFCLTAPAVLIVSIISSFLFHFSLSEALLVLLIPIVFCVFSALLNILIGITFPNLNWTNEITPIKQGLAVMLALVSNALYLIIIGFIYINMVTVTDNTLLLTVFLLITTILSFILYILIVRIADRKLQSL